MRLCHSKDDVSIYLIGALMFSQLMQPHKNINVHAIAQKFVVFLEPAVLGKIRNKHPAHPVLVADLNVVDQQRSNSHRDQWNVDDCEVILLCIKEVLFSDFGFKSNHE